MSKDSFKDVFWVIDGVGEKFSTHLASSRYSAIIPAGILGGNVTAYDPETLSADDFLKRYRPRALIFTKAFDWRFIDLAKAARRRGIKTVATVVDWHFEKDFNKSLFAMTDLLVAQTSEMARTIQELVGREAVIIEEPYEGKRNFSRFAPDGPLKLLWYGSNNNLDGLELALRQISRRAGNHVRLLVICESAEKAHEVVQKTPESSSLIECQIHKWTPELQDMAIAETDIVLIPNPLTDKKKVKGHNRLVAAINGGRLALASPLPQYLELGDFCWCGKDMADGIDWAVKNSGIVEKRVAVGQDYIDRRFSPKAVARRWREEVEKLLNWDPSGGRAS